MLSPATSRAVLATLRGDEVAPAAERDLVARARDGDDDAARALREHDGAARGVALTRAALARERLVVTLADGSALPLHDAERMLTVKEEHGAHRPLRAAVERALREVRWFDDGATVGDDLVRRCRAFLHGTSELARAALEVLDGHSVAPIDDEPALARALDLPAPAFRVDVALALLAGARTVAGGALPSVRVPRALAGVVLHDERPKLGVFAEGTRLARWARLLEGGSAVLAQLAGVAPELHGGLALGLMVPVALARVGVARREAVRGARAAVARAVLAARAQAAFALAPWDEALGGAVPRSVRPTLAVRELVDARALGEELWSTCERQLEAASAALTLRDAWDEAFAMSARCWREPVELVKRAPAEAWTAWASSLL